MIQSTTATGSASPDSNQNTCNTTASSAPVNPSLRSDEVMTTTIQSTMTEMKDSWTQHSMLDFQQPMVPIMPIRGRIEIIMGPMFSGKSTELLRRLQRHKIACKNVLLVKHSSDLRYDGSELCVVTHDQVKLQAKLIIEELNDSIFERQEYREAEIIGIDEAQFFGNSLPRIVDQIAHEGKTVIVAGLDGDFRRNPFGPLLDLIPMAEKVKKMSAVCFNCGNEASFTQRTIFNDSSHKIDQVQIVGGSEMYKPVCRACYRAFDEEDRVHTSSLQPDFVPNGATMYS